MVGVTRAEGEAFVRAHFHASRPRLLKLCAGFSEDAEAVVNDALMVFDAMLPTLAYVETPEHPLAAALFTCSVTLSAFQVLRLRGVDAHAFGAAMLFGLSRAPVTPAPIPAAGSIEAEAFRAIGEQSLSDAAADEDAFTVVYDVATSTASEVWGYDVHRCAIHTLYSRYDASDLTPYMCAVDDIMSDKGAQGLRRTGSLALGATHCDFRYQRGTPPLSLASQYPALIQLRRDA